MHQAFVLSNVAVELMDAPRQVMSSQVRIGARHVEGLLSTTLRHLSRYSPSAIGRG